MSLGGAIEEEGRGGAIAPERRGLRRGGESRAASPRGPRPRAGPAPPPCPEASTAAGARRGGELCRRRGRLWDSASRRFGGSWVARARAPHAPARSRRAACGGHHAGWRPSRGASPGWRACVAAAAVAGSLRGVPARPRGDSLPAGAGHPMRSRGRPDRDGHGAHEPRADPCARPWPHPGLQRAVSGVQTPRAVHPLPRWLQTGSPVDP